MNGKTKTDNLFVKSIDKEVKAVNKDPIIRRNIMKWEMKLREARDDSEAKGMKKGLEIGLEQGRQQGLEQGRQQGLEQGSEQEKEDTIVSSLKAKLPIQLIAQIARTTIEKVRETAKKHNLENLIVNN